MHINRKRQSDSETALDAQSGAQEATPKRRAFSLQRIALACVGALGTGSLLALAGCPANLEDPQRFNVPGIDAGPSGGGTAAGGSGAGGAVSVVPAPACATDIFKASCIMCHVAGNALSAGLDLSGADVAKRLVGVNAMHMQADPASCSKVNLIDTTTPSASWILAKINGAQGKCGSPMPLTGTPLTTAQIACLTTFAMSEASGSAAPAGAAGASATATGGSGGM